ncbi:MAG: hypothetical protein FD146_968 [Anaerolineaceae bacterium]|nr:MAG: hypothetical protein FD146_968 [Anaerolineaceae bacterium]
MKISKLVSVLILLLALGAASLYYWEEFHSVEFYPILHTRCLKPTAYDNSLAGQLVLVPHSPDVYDLSEIFSTSNMIYDLKTGQMTPVNEKFMTGNFSSSPDERKLAYEEIEIENGQEVRYLVIRSYKGIETRVKMEAGQSLVYWLDNHSVVLRKRNPENLPEVAILNLDTTEFRNFIPEFPDVIDGKNHYQFWDNTWPVVGYYSPDRTRVLYPDNSEYTYSAGDSSFVEHFCADLILYNEEHREQLLRIKQIDKLDEVEWKQDSSGFFVALNNIPAGKDLNWGSSELRFIDRNGLTRWNMNLADVKRNFRYSLIGYLSLSPNERYLTFEGGLASFPRSRLFLDTMTGDIFDYCLENTSPGGVWSPDSKYFALSSDHVDKVDTLIVDIVNRKVYKIAEGYIPVGWLK